MSVRMSAVRGGERDEAVADIARRQHAELVAQNAGRAAVV